MCPRSIHLKHWISRLLAVDPTEEDPLAAGIRLVIGVDGSLVPVVVDGALRLDVPPPLP